jgi:Mg-chelatase subunit ChlD
MKKKMIIQASGGTTDAALALTDSVKLLDLRPRKAAETIVIVITDGRSQVC